MNFRWRFLLQAILCLASSCLPMRAQQNGRFADLKEQAFNLFQKGRYAEVAGKMEEIWEQDQSDPKVAEYLAMGYLYGEHDADKARPLMDQAIAKGGQATFLVAHSHERLSVLQGDTMNQFCNGRISISPGKLVFVSDSGEHSATITSTDLRDFSVLSGPSGRIRIKAAGKSYVFRVKTQTREEAILLGHVAQENLKQ